MILMNKSENRKLLLITRIILFVIGFTLGFLAMWQVLAENPEIAKRLALKIVFYAAGGLVPAVVLALSAKPVYLVFAALGRKIRSRAAIIKPNDVAAVMLGVLVGTLAGFGTETVFKLFLKIVALRIFIDIIVAVIAAYVAVILSLQWLKISESDTDGETADSESKKESLQNGNGYLLSVSAFSGARIASLCEKWLNGKKYALDGTEELLDDAGKEVFLSMSEKGLIEKLGGSELNGRVRAEEQAAKERNLKIIVLTAQDASNYSAETELLVLDEI